jgi:hypothetical protein
MLGDIESGKINMVITKDLSRLGRDYIMTGYYTEIYFNEKGVRYIAVNDNIDTINDNNYIVWYYALICAFCIAIPVTIMLSLQRITIDLSCDKVELFYLVNDNKNERDYNSNWIIYPSEIESIEVVKLSKEEKRRYTSARFLFSKYLKINLKFGHCKYVYVSHYSNKQIKKIIQMLTKKH